MLRRADNVSLSFKPIFLSSKGWLWVQIGRDPYKRREKMLKDEYQAYLALQYEQPWCVIRVGDRAYWQFQGKFYWDNDGLSAHEVYALLVTRQQRARRQVDNAVATVAMGAEPRQSRRGAIPDDVKMLVWTRDQGKCRHCGSPVELQFDHIIPVAKGGASTPENLQILCGPCNRKKSDGLTI